MKCSGEGRAEDYKYEIQIYSTQNINFNRFSFNLNDNESVLKSNEILKRNEKNCSNSKQVEIIKVNNVLNVIYDDYKGLWDYGQKLSDDLVYKIQNNEKQYDIINSSFNLHDFTDSTAECSSSFISNYQIFSVYFNTDPYVKVYIRKYKHFLEFIPFLISIFACIINGTYYTNVVLNYHYKYFDFMNKNCLAIKINQLNSNNISNNSSNNMLTKEIVCNQDRINVAINNNDKIADNLDIINDNKSHISVENTENKNICNINDEYNSKLSKLLTKKINYIEEKPHTYDMNDDNNFLNDSFKESYFKYTFLDSILFMAPTCCQSKITKEKYKFYKDVKQKLHDSNPSYSSIISNISIYLINLNLIRIIGKNELLKPIFKYSYE